MEVITHGIWKMSLGTPEKITPLQFREYPIATEGLNKLPGISQSPLHEFDISFKKDQ